MKKIINRYSLAVLGAAALLAAVSCKKSFIDLTDPTRIITSEYYKDSASIATAVTACYASLQEMYGKSSASRGVFPYGEVASDNATAVVEGTGIGEFEYFSFTSANPVLQSSWTYMYRCIARCNVVLARIDPVTMNAGVKSRFQSEVKAIRALAYFNLVRIWGDVPLVTKEIQTVAEAYQYGRTPVADVYAQIEKDLTEADADVNLPAKYTANVDLGRITKAAVKGLLSKVYLTEKKYTEAGNKLNEFITAYDGTTHSLLANYSDIYLTSNELNAEIVLAVRYTKGNVPGTGSPFTNYFAYSTSNAGGVGTGYQYCTLRKDLIDTMAANGAADKRTAASYTTSGTTYGTKKYADVPAADLDSDCDWIVLRYADVLLMYAEVLNEQSSTNVATAITYLNRVRVRAGLTALVAATQTQGSLRLAIEKERRIELNMEGHRWFDLVRTGRAIEVMNNHFTKYAIKLNASSPVVQIDAHNLLFPIPISEINTVGLVLLPQNFGY